MYVYILTQRPPSIGTHPIQGLEEVKEITFKGRNAFALHYSIQLSVEDIKRYELTPDYATNGLIEYKFTFAGEEITEHPQVTGHNEITTLVDGDIFEKYSFYNWFRRFNNID